MKIIFDRNICNKIRENNPTNYKTEQGGIILGQVFENYLILTDLTLPSPNDKSSISSFFRHKDYAQEKITTEWNNSKGTINYIGEWHTHFENNPIPSNTDKKMIKEMVNTTIMEINFLLLLIIGIDHVFLGMQKEKGNLSNNTYYSFNNVPYQQINTF